MKKVNQYVGGIFFAALIALPIVFIIGLHIAQWRAQNLAKQNLENSFLQTLVLKTADLQWEKKGRELRIGKRLFDVKHISYKDGTAVITGLYDEAEMAIEKQVEKSSLGNSSFAALLLLMQTFVAVHLSFFISHKWHVLRCFYKFILPLYQSPVMQVPHPPPLF